MAGVVAPGRVPGGGRVDGARTRTAARALVRMRRSMLRHLQGGQELLVAGIVTGVLLASASFLLGYVRFPDPGRVVDLWAAVNLGWLMGWILGPIAFRGGGQGLRPEYFALLPIRPRRLAAAFLAAAFTGWSPAITLLGLAGLGLAAAGFGAPSLAVAIAGVLAQLVVIVLLSKVVVEALTATLNSRRGRDLGGLLLAVVVAIASGGWSVATLMGQQLAAGASPALSGVLRALPSGWAPVAVGAAERGAWPLALAALLGLAALAGLLLLAWAALLQRNMIRASGQAPGAWLLRRKVAVRPAAPRKVVLTRLLPAGPLAAVVGKELISWRREVRHSFGLILAVLLAVLNFAVPAIAFDAPGMLPWVGIAVAVFSSMTTGNLWGDEGTAFWLTRMNPGTERVDVRGRQLAWLVAVGPFVVALTVALTALSGQTGAWPYVLALLPALLGGTAGLMVTVSAWLPVKQKDPHLQSGPFDTGEDPNAAGAVAAVGWLMLLLVATAAVPAFVLVLLGDLAGNAALQWTGVAAGLATGALLTWWGGRAAIGRITDRGAELMDLLHLGPPPKPTAEAGGPAVSKRASRASNALMLLGIVLVFPQGLVPILFTVLGVDESVRIWFLARYLPQPWQVLVAVACVVAGTLAFWWATRLRQPRAPTPDQDA